MFRMIVAVAALLLNPATAFADETPPASTSGKITVGGAKTSGDSQTEHLNVSLKLKHVADLWTHELVSEFLNQKETSDGDSTYTQKFDSEASSRRMVGERNFLKGTFWYQQYRESGYRFGSEVSLAFGRTFAPAEGITASLEAGPGWFRSEEDNGRVKDSLIGRMAAEGKIAWEKAALSEKITISTGDEYTTTRSNTTLSTTVAGLFSLETSAKITYIDAPLPDKAATDTTLTLGLSYGF